MSENAAIYARVSTKEQEPDTQLRQLRTYCRQRGFEVHGEYVDHGISGAKERRPELDRLMDDARKRRFDVILVWRFDRFARSTRHLVNALEEFRNLGIQFISYNENVDTGSPIGEAMFTVISAIAQLERNILRARVQAGVDRARARGKKLGRPAVKKDTGQIQVLREKGLSIRVIAKQTGVSRSGVHRALISK